MEEKIKNAYKEYLKLPKAECSGENKNAELYVNRWYVLMGRSFSHPHPHRHYTLIEFAFWVGNKSDLQERFMNNYRLSY